MDKDRLHIILCDDDEDDREFFDLVARQWAPHVMVTTVESAESLLKALGTSDTVDLVFLDLNMPVVSGRECLKLIRENKALDRVAVIIYSTAADDRDVEATFRNGANLYVQKPASTAGLTSILDKIAAMDKVELMVRQRRKFVLDY